MPSRSSLKMSATLLAGVVSAALTASLALPAAAANSTGKVTATRGHHAYVAQRRHGVVRQPSPVYGYAVPPGAIAEPGGYLYVPGRGILGESCNLPTSACPNSDRDIQ